MKQSWIAAVLAAMLLLSGCSGSGETSTGGENPSYTQISAKEAKAMMEEHPEAVILDVREQNEYDEKHIPEAVLLPVGSIEAVSAAAVIPDKDTIVLVYCRSGNRSKTASATLAVLGYTAVYEFGGINSWPYETES